MGREEGSVARKVGGVRDVASSSIRIGFAKSDDLCFQDQREGGGEPPTRILISSIN